MLKGTSQKFPYGVSDFEQSITWFERVLGFRVVARDANEFAELSRGETSLQLAADDAPYWKPERPGLLPPGQRGSGVEIVLLVDNVEAVYRQAQQALQRLQGTAKKDGYGYTYSDRYGYYGYSNVAFEVARAAEEIRPHAAIELYRQFAKRLIAMRDRNRYELACTYLVKVRALYEKRCCHGTWWIIRSVFANPFRAVFLS
jgi:catechol 2,3-dioxygenase-like lactoylglutathione lyase family enzyme